MCCITFEETPLSAWTRNKYIQCLIPRRFCLCSIKFRYMSSSTTDTHTAAYNHPCICWHRFVRFMDTRCTAGEQTLCTIAARDIWPRQIIIPCIVNLLILPTMKWYECPKNFEVLPSEMTLFRGPPVSNIWILDPPGERPEDPNGNISAVVSTGIRIQRIPLLSCFKISRLYALSTQRKLIKSIYLPWCQSHVPHISYSDVLVLKSALR